MTTIYEIRALEIEGMSTSKCIVTMVAIRMHLAFREHAIRSVPQGNYAMSRDKLSTFL